MHLALFAYLAHVMPVLRSPSYGPQPDIQLAFAPRLPLAPSAIPVPAPAPRQSRAVERQAQRAPLAVSRPQLRPAAPARAIQARPTPAPVQHAPAAPPAPPSNASAYIPAAGAKAGVAQGANGGGAGRGGAPANLPGDEERDGVRTFLRATVGCSHVEYLHLNAAERANCDRRAGKDARAVANLNLDALPSEKRAYYDAVREAYAATHDARTPVDTTAGGATWTGQGGHGIGFGCKYGKCGITPPQGVGTEEADVPKQ